MFCPTPSVTSVSRCWQCSVLHQMLLLFLGVDSVLSYNECYFSFYVLVVFCPRLSVTSVSRCWQCSVLHRVLLLFLGVGSVMSYTECYFCF